MAKIGWKWLDMAGNGGNGLKWMEMAGSCWNDEIGWNWLEMAGNSSKNVLNMNRLVIK